MGTSFIKNMVWTIISGFVVSVFSVDKHDPLS